MSAAVPVQLGLMCIQLALISFQLAYLCKAIKK